MVVTVLPSRVRVRTAVDGEVVVKKIWTVSAEIRTEDGVE